MRHGCCMLTQKLRLVLSVQAMRANLHYASISDAPMLQKVGKFWVISPIRLFLHKVQQLLLWKKM